MATVLLFGVRFDRDLTDAAASAAAGVFRGGLQKELTQGAVDGGPWGYGAAMCESVVSMGPASGYISRGSIIEALRDAERNDSAADAVEFISDLVDWVADGDEVLKAERRDAA